jgi:hypothetical protein
VRGTRCRDHAGDRAEDGRPRARCYWVCHHGAVLSADDWSDDVHVPWFGPRMVCTGCGIVGADAWAQLKRPAIADEPDRGAVEQMTLAKTLTAESIAADRARAHDAILSCVRADWQKAGVTHATAQHIMVRGLIERDQGATRYVLTDQGRAVLAALLANGVRTYHDDI